MAEKGPLVVIKVGTSTLMRSADAVNLANFGRLVDTVALLHKRGARVIIVTSAAIGFGCIKLNFRERPTSLALKQACAAAGQSALIRMYEDLFGVHSVRVAQILLCRSDFSSRDRFENFRSAMNELLNLNVIPIINENDTVSVAELRFGDNDTLSALVAVGVAADKLFLLTDVDYLFTADPRTCQDAMPIKTLTSKQLADFSGATADGSSWGTGGMATKLVAARTAVAAGVEVLLANGSRPERVTDFLLGALPFEGTRFRAEAKSEASCSGMTRQRRWLLALPVRGELAVDAGAAEALARKKSLFSAGIVAVEGGFLRDECVRIRCEGREVARALVNLNSEEVRKVQGKQSHEHPDILGYNVESEVAFREHIVLI